ncbi:MAG: lambda exonuclease family protein [Bacteroidota bacterium]
MKVINCKQQTAEWWQARRGVPTASEFKRICTPKKWQYADGAVTYAQELIAELYDPFYGCHEDYVSAAMAHGSAIEPEARRFYEFNQGVQVEQVGFCTTDDGLLGCSPDGLVGDDGGIECKAPKIHTHIRWLLDGGVPPEHLAQCHGFLVVTGRQWVDFLSYCPQLPELLVRVERDEKTQQLAGCLNEFCGCYAALKSRIESKHRVTPNRTVSVAGETYEKSFVESYF